MPHTSAQLGHINVLSLNPVGSPMLMASASVDVTVLDVNESPPEFSAANYTASVNENTDVGYSLIQVSATDPDLGSNAIVSYSLIGPNANQLRYTCPVFSTTV